MMCRFHILVLVPEHSRDTAAEISHRMLPYSWHREVPVRDAPCFCIGKDALEQAPAQACAQMGTLSTYKEAFEQVLSSHMEGNNLSETDRLLGWNSYIEDYGRLERELFHKHPLKNAALPTCAFCHGTGTRKSVKNHEAKWDKYSLTDMVSVPDLLARGEVYLTLLRPLGIVSEQGWRDMGEISPLTKTPVLRCDWYSLALRLLKGYPQHIAGITDCEM